MGDRDFTAKQKSIIMNLSSCIDILDDMNKEVYVKKILQKDELPIYQGNRFYGIRVPAAVRKKYGCGIPACVTGKTREIVVQKLFDILIGLTPRGSDKTLTMLFEEFIAKREKDIDFAAHTVRKNICDWNTFFKDTLIARSLVSAITPADLKDHFKTMTEGRKMTRHAFGNAKGLLNQLFDLAYEQNLIERNICRELSTRDLKFRPEECKQDLIYTSEEREKICNALRDSDNIYDKAIIMQFCLGCRISEVKGLCWEDVDFEHKTVYIHREVVDGEVGQIIKEQTKSGLSDGNRILPLTSRAEEVLLSIPRMANDASLIFAYNFKPIRTQTVNDHLREVCRSLGIRYLSTHKIRAWGITEALASGMDQASVMRIAGHASPQTMKYYVRTGRIRKDIDDKYAQVFD